MKVEADLREQELKSAQTAQKSAEEKASSLERDLAVLSTECDSLQATSKGFEAKHASALERQSREAESAAAILRDQIADLERQLKASHEADSDHTATVAALNTKLIEAEQASTTHAREREEWQQERSALEAAVAEAKAAVQKEQVSQSEALAAAEAKQAELQSRLTSIEAEKKSLSDSLAESASQIGALKNSLDDAQQQIESLKAANVDASDVVRQLDEARKLVESRDQAHRDLQADLSEAKRQLAALRDSTCSRTDLNDLQQKFDLALADIQKLKRENGELRDEVSTRPAASDEESPELVTLRADRDMLASRVAELEQAAIATAGATAQQEFEDLHRRFEMAVEDVRELKQVNAQLRDQLAAKAIASPAGLAVANGRLDWAAQKARLLASLAEEDADGPLDASRKKERLTIEITIEATDRALAEKDRELAELRAAQRDSARLDAISADRDRNEKKEDFLNSDELVAKERERLTQLQSELQSKLRAAELELSVERAKLAREQANLKERLFDLEKMTPKTAEGDNVSGKPRRRWLSALGLGEEGDETEAKKK
jgi:hypothetical protein